MSATGSCEHGTAETKPFLQLYKPVSLRVMQQRAFWRCILAMGMTWRFPVQIMCHNLARKRFVNVAYTSGQRCASEVNMSKVDAHGSMLQCNINIKVVDISMSYHPQPSSLQQEEKSTPA